MTHERMPARRKTGLFPSPRGPLDRGLRRRTGASAATLVAVGLAAMGPGCASDRQTGAAVGAGIGAVAGGVAGYAIGGDKGMAVGAVLGGLGGAIIGSEVMKQRARELERKVGRTSEVAHVPESRGEQAEPYEMIVVSMTEDRGRVLFDAGQDSLTPQMTRQLEPVVDFLHSHRDLNIAIVGHTDSSAPLDEQVAISHRRADAVAMYLLARGVAPERIVTRGAGAYAPLASDETTSGRARNRRVDMIFFEKSEQAPEVRVAVAAGRDGPAADSRPAAAPRADEPRHDVAGAESPTEKRLEQGAIRPASELAEIYTGTEEGRESARAEQRKAAEAVQGPPVSPIRPASELLKHKGADE